MAFGKTMRRVVGRGAAILGVVTLTLLGAALFSAFFPAIIAHVAAGTFLGLVVLSVWAKKRNQRATSRPAKLKTEGSYSGRRNTRSNRSSPDVAPSRSLGRRDLTDSWRPAVSPSGSAQPGQRRGIPPRSVPGRPYP
jgi:hypothetical protein